MKKHKINRWKRTGSYTFQKQLPIRDNRNIYDPMIGDSFFDKSLSLSEWVSLSSKIRVPSLKCKSTWKRFYKLYPHLKGMKAITGSSSSLYHGLNASTIKLKKVKK